MSYVAPDTLKAAIETIGRNFARERNNPLKNNPLAKIIQNDWPALVRKILHKASIDKYIKVKGKAGIGRWNRAPFVAIMNEHASTTPENGFYVVYLFEPELKTICVVLGQGVTNIKKRHGAAKARVILERRAEFIRNIIGEDRKAQGFSDGPFKTIRAASKPAAREDDEWSVAASFGKRYYINDMPNEDELASDLVKMVKLYSGLVQQNAEELSDSDDGLKVLLSENESTKTGTVEGAVKTSKHKNEEKQYRYRNKKLIKDVKEALGNVCQGCDFSFEEMYGEAVKGYIEAHHLQPVSKIPSGGVTMTASSKYFSVLCSNCHRAIHAQQCPPLKDFRESIKRKLTLSVKT